MGWKGLERNKLDFILTDLLPVELSERFSFRPFYDFLNQIEQQRTLNQVVERLKVNQAKGSEKMFSSGWSTMPLKYSILKGNDSYREMSVIQPLSVLNLYLFMECYQKDILNYLSSHHCYSIRYHKKNNDLFYKSRSKHAIQYFSIDMRRRVDKAVVQQVGNYFKIAMFESINSFADSHIWRMANFEYGHFAQMDYKSCFDSIYTHVYKWIIEHNIVDSINADNSNVFITIDRVLQNINGKQSNGIPVGPEFSRLIAEILLQRIDTEVKLSLLKHGFEYGKNYKVFRYVDDIFAFADSQETLSRIISTFNIIGNRYLLHLNELKLIKGLTPSLPKRWIERTRSLVDNIDKFFLKYKKDEYNNLPEDDKHLVKNGYIPVDRAKDEFLMLINDFPDNKRTIVSFLLSALLNSIGKVRDGYRLFGNGKVRNALQLLDLAFFIYSFSTTYESTRKLISMISYMNDEVKFNNKGSDENEKLKRIIHRYAFIFQRGNLPDLCDWFPFLEEYNICLDAITEEIILSKSMTDNNPIIWANILMYAQYYKPLYIEVKRVVEDIVNSQIMKLSEKEPMMHREFWYLLVFHNCPFLDSSLLHIMSKIVVDIYNNANVHNSGDVMKLVCKYLNSSAGSKPLESFFDWKGGRSYSKQIAYRTFQRTIFKKFKGNRYGLFVSIE